MIVGIHPSHCGYCGTVVEYKVVSDAPHGLIFRCTHPLCEHNQWHQLPELRCERYYPTPVLLTKDANRSAA